MRIADISPQIGCERSLWIRVAGRITLLVVVAKLDEVVLTLFGRSFIPGSLIQEALRASTIQRVIHAGFIRGESCTKNGSPATPESHGRIAYEYDLYGRTVVVRRSIRPKA